MAKTQIVDNGKIYNVDTDKGTVTPASKSGGLSDVPFDVAGKAVIGAIDVADRVVGALLGCNSEK